jgi:tetratricopeptide (TPR) repeat protein
MSIAGSAAYDNRAQAAARLLATQPAQALQEARTILREAPQHPLATLVLGTAHRRLGALDRAIATLRALVREQPTWSLAHYELAVALGDAGQAHDALQSLRQATKLQPDLADAWRRMADHLIDIGDPAAANQAYANHLAVSTSNPKLRAAAAALCEDRLGDAEKMLVAHLQANPRDVDAMRMLAEVAARVDRLEDAAKVLELCLQLAPGYTTARYNYAVVLQRLGRTRECLAECDRLFASDARNPNYLNVRANARTSIGEFATAIEDFSILLSDYPQNAKIWLAYGHALKTAGRRDDCVAAYRRSIELAPSLGEAYWSLANLKTFRFTDADVAAISAQLAREDLPDEDRLHFHFALGKALEDRQTYAASFEQYATGNRVRRAAIQYAAEDTTRFVRRSKAMFTPQFLAGLTGSGSPSDAPIFVVGLPRSGSTLIEQILASHSRVEGTMELTDVGQLARAVYDDPPNSRRDYYPEALAALPRERFSALGERYLEQTRIQRKTNAPHFIDKMPNNWTHVGFIHLMLPNARIIDARRHPMSACFANFKQHFARGQYFTFDLADLGAYYRDYVDLMAHFDRLLPGRVHRVFYERMVDDTEVEIRRLLDYCGLPFEESCLRFYENDRAVRTPSAEQVRQPIFREGVELWRHYEPWLNDLKTALGPVLSAYPEAPTSS